jgi:hypothetical protein
VRALAIVVLLAACSESSTPSLGVERATPGYGPLVGGTVVTLHGSGFQPSARVLIAGHEAPLTHVIEDTRIDVIIPPGDRAGDAEVTVFHATGSASMRGIFRYSAPPAITMVSPSDVVATSGDTVVTVRGNGFLDEGAGEPTLVVGGQLVTNVAIESDTKLTFVAPAGRAFVRPHVEVINVRGRAAAPRAFRYTPGVRPGLLLFPRWGASFAVFYDPVDRTTTAIPAVSGAVPRFSSVVRGDDGVYWAVEAGTRIGRLDLETQTLTATVPAATRMPAIARIGERVIGLARNWGGGGRFGTLDLATGAFDPIGTTTLWCCGSYGIAFDGTTVWFTAREDWSTVYLNTVDPVTGVTGTPVTLAGGAGFRVEELRAWNGTLYATSASGTLVTLDPATGAIDTLTQPAERYSAFEVFE